MAKILIVDDEASICTLLEIAFRSQGHAVESATSVDAALRKLDVMSVPMSSNPPHPPQNQHTSPPTKSL